MDGDGQVKVEKIGGVVDERWRKRIGHEGRKRGWNGGGRRRRKNGQQ